MTEWLATYEKDGEVFFRIGRDGPDLVVAEWLGIVRLVARRDGSTHAIEPDPEADPRELAKVQRGGIRLLLRHLAGRLALHGACVALGHHAVVLLGRATQGKSTLAAALCARGAAALLADDAVALDPDASGAGYQVTGLEELHWLDAGARAAVEGIASAAGTRPPGALAEDPDAEKIPMVAPRVAREATVVAFVDLAFVEDGPPRLVRTTPLEGMAALVPQAVRFVLDDPAVHRRELEALGRVVDTVPIFRLERPRNLALLSASCDLVLELLREARPASKRT